MFTETIQQITDFFQGLHFIDVVDIVIVCLLIYQLFNLIRGTAAFNIFFGILAIYLLWKFVIFLKMKLLAEILGQFISVGVIALIIVFQQEIRKFLLFLGSPQISTKTKRRFLFWRLPVAKFFPLNQETLCEALEILSLKKTGALLILTRKIRLEDISRTGVALDSLMSVQLIQSIFWKNSPLHDGAIIISGNRIIAARCILPLSEQYDLPDDVGLRHRAATGITEKSDALAIVVSEQTGEISVAIQGQLKRNITVIELKDILSSYL